MRQARLGLGGDKLDAPTDQHDKRYGCSGRGYAKRSSAHGRRIVPARLAVARHDMSRDGKGGQKAALSLVVDGVAYPAPSKSRSAWRAASTTANAWP